MPHSVRRWICVAALCAAILDPALARADACSEAVKKNNSLMVRDTLDNLNSKPFSADPAKFARDTCKQYKRFYDISVQSLARAKHNEALCGSRLRVECDSACIARKLPEEKLRYEKACAEADRLDQLAETAKADALTAGGPGADLERQFVAELHKKHKSVIVPKRAAIALGYSKDETSQWVEHLDGMVDLPKEARRKLSAFQSNNHLSATGFLDSATFIKLLDQPVEISRFGISQPGAQPLEIDDWFFGSDGLNCTIVTKPVSIAGRFLPDFNHLPLIHITSGTLLKEYPPVLSQRYADVSLYEGQTDIHFSAGNRIKLDHDGYRSTVCDAQTCRIVGDAMKELKNNRSIKVVGTSVMGGDLVIEYSTKGFLSAFNRMDSECGKNTFKSLLQ